jgi:hypothetical protein
MERKLLTILNATTFADGSHALHDFVDTLVQI